MPALMMPRRRVWLYTGNQAPQVLSLIEVRPGALIYVLPSQGQAPGPKVTKVLRGNSGGPERKGEERPGIKAIESQGARKRAGAR